MQSLQSAALPVTYEHVSVATDTLVMRRITKRTELGWCAKERTSSCGKHALGVILQWGPTVHASTRRAPTVSRRYPLELGTRQNAHSNICQQTHTDRHTHTHTHQWIQTNTATHTHTLSYRQCITGPVKELRA